MNLVGLAGQTRLICNTLLGRGCEVVGRLRSRHVQRRVPKCLPPVLIQDLRSNLDTETLQRQKLLIGHPPDAGNDMELWLQISDQRAPCPSFVPESDVLDYWCSVLKAKTQPDLVVLFAIPDEGENFLSGIRSQSWRGLVFRQVANLRVNGGRREDAREGDQFRQVAHGTPSERKLHSNARYTRGNNTGRVQ